MADENDFNMTAVSSSQIAAVGFNAATSQGRVEFVAKGSRGPSLYEYDSVTEDEYSQIVNGAIGGSVGITFGNLWKNVKVFRRIS
jgi:hypothetical protein